MTGLADMIAKLRAADARVRAAAVRATDEYGDKLLAESKKLCPMSPTNPTLEGKRKKRIKNPYNAAARGTGGSGDLVNSGVSDAAVLTATRLTKTVKYTDSKAAAVHERPARHGAAFKAAFPAQNVPNLQAKWKFLAIPMIQMRAGFLPYVANQMRGAL